MSTVRKPPLTDKTVQRRLFLEKRRVLAEDAGRKNALDSEIQSRLILSSVYRDASAVMIYVARGNEIGTSMIIHAALANHKIVAVPRCEDGGVMRFYRIGGMNDLIPGSFGIPEPREGCELFTPDAHTLCVCPCLCCDMQGYRLGFGAGYYDRYLAGFEGMTAALCYADALLPQIVREPHDIPIQYVFTEQYVKAFP